VAANYQVLKERKVLAARVPAELGGDGASVADLAGMLRTLAHHCGSTALALSMHTHLVATNAWRWRNQKAPVEGLLKRVVAEDLVLVSTGGADFLLGSGKAEKVEGGYRVTGRKIFCSGAPAGALMLTTAIHDQPGDGPTVLQFALPIAAKGVQIQDNWRTLGMRGTGSHDVTLEEVFVPEASVTLRRPSGAWHPFIHVVCMVALPVFNAVYIGVAEAARNLALEMAQRKRGDRLVQAAAGEMENELTAAQLALARMYRPGHDREARPADLRRGPELQGDPRPLGARDRGQGHGGGGRRLLLPLGEAGAALPRRPGRPLPPAAGEAPGGDGGALRPGTAVGGLDVESHYVVR
jgi:acyl-CoA dehydrogenase